MRGCSTLYHKLFLFLLLTALNGFVLADENSRLQGQVEAALYLSPELSSRVLTVAVDDGAVTVSGTVGSAEERQLVVDIVTGLPGVDSVSDDLTLQSASGQDIQLSAAQQAAFENWQLAHIAKELRQSFADSPALDGDNIEFTLDGDTLRLEGSVNTEIERTIASQLAQRLDRVQVVDNQLEVNQGSEPVELEN